MVKSVPRSKSSTLHVVSAEAFLESTLGSAVSEKFAFALRIDFLLPLAFFGVAVVRVVRRAIGGGKPQCLYPVVPELDKDAKPPVVSDRQVLDGFSW